MTDSAPSLATAKSTQAIDPNLNLAERVRVYWNHAPISVIGDIFCAVLLYTLLLELTDSLWLHTWFATAIALNAGMSQSYYTFRKEQWSVWQIHNRWKPTIIGLSLLHGISWGVINVMAYLVSPEQYFEVGLLIIMGLASASVSSMGAIFPLFLMHKILLITPSVAAIIISGNASEQWATALFMLFFLLIVIASGRHYAISLQASMNLRHAHTDALKQLQIEIDSRKSFQEKLVEEHLKSDAANKAKSVFLANMSHELRTPLNGIIGYTELAKESVAANDLSSMPDDLDKVEQATRHLLNLINNLLDISKIEAGKLDLLLAPVKIGDVLNYVRDAMQPLMIKNGNTLDIINSAHLEELRTDALRLKQILLNLTSNACKFTKMGKITILVDRVHTNNTEYASFIIRDTGIGMTEKQMNNLFKAYTQADAETAAQYGGTGLGLALSRQLAQLLGGNITVTSQYNKGSEFTLLLPMGNADKS